jgi:hypothetical protein
MSPGGAGGFLVRAILLRWSHGNCDGEVPVL